MDNGSNSTLNVYPNIEAIAEFKVLTSNYGAQYGRNASGTIEVETKSGTNSFHGSAFEYLRNDMFNARPWESGADPTHPNPPYKKHDFGYTVGGPDFHPAFVQYAEEKDVLLLFGRMAARKEPAQLQRESAFGCRTSRRFLGCARAGTARIRRMATPFPGNIVPIDPNAQFFLAVLPQANGTNDGFPTYTNSTSLPTTWRKSWCAWITTSRTITG